MSKHNVSAAPRPLYALLARLHFYIGLLVGPFLLISALSGIFYALTPQIENHLYDHALHTDSVGEPLTIAEQIRAVQSIAGASATVTAVRPAPARGDTTRVLFAAPERGPSMYRALFVDPVNGQIRGDLTVYGSSGALPLRTWIDQFHRGLMLGDGGRLYSELAASWLWVAAIGGLILWGAQRRKKARARMISRKGLRGVHATLGLVLLAGLLFFSVTGLTWSKWAGGNIGVLRAHWGWATPNVSTALSQVPSMSMPMDEHAEHHMAGAHRPDRSVTEDLSVFDAVLRKARAEDITSAQLEIRPATRVGMAWTVTEVDRSWPTHADAVAIDAATLRLVDKVEFARLPLAAKLTRWGIDAHMGMLFGLANQLLLALVASGLVVMIVLGYLMWWRRRPTQPLHEVSQTTLLEAWKSLPRHQQVAVVVIAVPLGFAMPVLGCSLVCLIIWDASLCIRRAYTTIGETKRESR